MEAVNGTRCGPGWGSFYVGLHSLVSFDTEQNVPPTATHTHSSIRSYRIRSGLV